MGVTKQRNTDFRIFDANQKTNLPLEGRRNVLITSALPYVNNVPHLGNIIGSVLSADVFLRFDGSPVPGVIRIGRARFFPKSSETFSKSREKIPPELDRSDFAQLRRTFSTVFDNGYTSIDTQMQLHCGKCKKFLADRFVNGTCPHCHFSDARGDQCDGCGRLLDGVDLVDPKCLICGSKPTLEESQHIFLYLDRLTPQLHSFLDRTMETPDSRWSANAIAITKDWLKKGPTKRCITRDLQWGTPVPLAEFAAKVFYVWFDAPIGYLSITKSHLGNDWHRWWKNPDGVELFNFLGKDNVAFHSIIFPSTLLATNEPFTQPRHICATEYLNYEDQKFSSRVGLTCSATLLQPLEFRRMFCAFICFICALRNVPVKWSFCTQMIRICC